MRADPPTLTIVSEETLSNSITVEWVPSSQTGGFAISGYTLIYLIAFVMTEVPLTETTYTLSSLDPSTTV
jgi:hypothetical protein